MWVEDGQLSAEAGVLREAWVRWRDRWRIVDIPPLSQREPEWARHQMGLSPGYTIERWGCALLSSVMLTGWAGRNFSPPQLDAWLREHDGYVKDAVINWQALESVFQPGDRLRLVFAAWATTVRREMMWYWTPVRWRWGDPMEVYLRALDEWKIPVITEVDFDVSNEDLDQHFVLALGRRRDGMIVVNDPWSLPAQRRILHPARVWGFRLFLPVR